MIFLFGTTRCLTFRGQEALLLHGTSHATTARHDHLITNESSHDDQDEEGKRQQQAAARWMLPCVVYWYDVSAKLRLKITVVANNKTTRVRGYT
jgi:hypothetical protein